MNEQQIAQLHEDMTKLLQLIAELGLIAGKAVDIHTVTPRIGELSRDFLRITETHKDLLTKLYPLKPFTDVAAEIISVSGGHPIVRSIVARIQAMPAVEAETGLNAQSVLQLAWSLRESDAANGSGLIIDNLKHNIDAGGGCDAGIVARLAIICGDLLHTALVNIYNEEVDTYLGVNVNTGASAASYENDDIGLAKAISASTDDEYEATVRASLNSGANAARYENDDIDLAKAISASTDDDFVQQLERITLLEQAAEEVEINKAIAAAQGCTRHEEQQKRNNKILDASDTWLQAELVRADGTIDQCVLDEITKRELAQLGMPKQAAMAAVAHHIPARQENATYQGFSDEDLHELRAAANNEGDNESLKNLSAEINRRRKETEQWGGAQAVPKKPITPAFNRRPLPDEAPHKMPKIGGAAAKNKYENYTDEELGNSLKSYMDGEDDTHWQEEENEQYRKFIQNQINLIINEIDRRKNKEKCRYWAP